jgi:hypothetical protein
MKSTSTDSVCDEGRHGHLYMLEFPIIKDRMSINQLRLAKFNTLNGIICMFIQAFRDCVSGALMPSRDPVFRVVAYEDVLICTANA